MQSSSRRKATKKTAQHKKQNAKNGECRPIKAVQLSHQKTGRTQRQLSKTRPKNSTSAKLRTPSKQGKSRDPNLRSETSETTASVNRRQGACHQVSQKPLSLTIAPQYPSYHGASVGMAIIAQSFNRITLIITHSRIQRRKDIQTMDTIFKNSLIRLNSHLLYS